MSATEPPNIEPNVNPALLRRLRELVQTRGSDFAEGFVLGVKSAQAESRPPELPATYVRVDLFKPSGKWYDTTWVDMADWQQGGSVHGCVRAACNAEANRGLQASTRGHWGLRGDLDNYLGQRWIAVCLEPCHKHAHPVMLIGQSGLTHTPDFERQEKAASMREGRQAACLSCGDSDCRGLCE